MLHKSMHAGNVQISLVYDTASAGSVVSELKVKYFDTIPVCSALCILKTGFLFAASEAGDHGFYEFLSLGDDDDSVEASSSTIVQKEEGFEPLFFDPRPLRNVALVDTMMSLAPLTDMKIKNLIGAVRAPICCSVPAAIPWQTHTQEHKACT
jgi:Mono-functional DNA-alkylating methyl methanesulfonate N-term